MGFYNDWLTRRSVYTPQRIAIDDDAQQRSFTYAELNARARRIAALLHGSCGVQPGDRVACLAFNRIECLDLYFACGKLGAIFVPLNPRLPAAGVLELLQDCQPTLLVHDASFAAVADEATAGGIVGNALRMNPDHWLQNDNATPAPHAADEQDVAMILYTSGTTGRPKGAMITWRQIHWNVVNTTIGLQLTENDAAFLNMPLCHTGAWHVLLTPLMLLGGRMILQPKFDAARCNELIGPAGVSILFGVPTMLRMMSEADNFAEADFSQVRFAICGGEPCPVPLIELFQSRGVAIRQGYGLTEAGPNCFSLPEVDAIRRQGSIGFPNFFIDASLTDERGDEVEVGQVGELRMRGPHVFAGYWNNDSETRNTLHDGWLSTGDLMKRDAEGYYYVVGRKKEMYISGGENVYPAEVEQVLQSHPAVALAAVVPVSHPKWGESGWAFVQAHDDALADAAELLALCRQRLAKYQCPTHVTICEQLPVGQSGKINKLVLKQQAAALNTPS